MPSFHEEEVLRSGTAGVFTPHSLILNIESMADLFPEGLSIEDDPTFPQVIALHVHEYIHYLHNLTTRSGLSCLVDMFLLMHPLLQQKINDEAGREAGKAQQSHIRNVFNSICKSQGYVIGIPDGYKWRPISRWEFSQVTASFASMPEAIMDPEQQIEFDVKAVFSGGEELDFRLMPGLKFITEGIAYEIERDIKMRWGISAAKVDLSTPAYPYLMYGPLLEHLAGTKLTSKERIAIGLLSLLATSPSVVLTSLSKLTSRKPGTLGATLFTAIEQSTLEGFESYSTHFIDDLIPMIYKVLSGSEILTKGMEVYEALILKGLQSRTKHSALEIAFLVDKMDIETFDYIAGNLLERVIFQKKPDSALEIRWVGNEKRVEQMTRDMHEAFAVLQSCIHYVQQHLKSNRLETRQSLNPTPCPFKGACTVEQAAGNPQVCRSNPWGAYNLGENSVPCVYQAGVDAFKSLVMPSATVEETLPF